MIDMNLSLENEIAGRIRDKPERDMIRVSMFMHRPGLTQTKRCHDLANRIYISHFSFHYSSKRDLVIGFPPHQLIQIISCHSLT